MTKAPLGVGVNTRPHPTLSYEAREKAIII